MVSLNNTMNFIPGGGGGGGGGRGVNSWAQLRGKPIHIRNTV